jgi:HAD superfamily hydrolase (TIGR01509 family)
MAYKVLLFDLDDTLIHFEDYWKVSLLETFRQHHSTKEYDIDLLFDVYWRQNGVFEEMYHKQVITLQQFRNYRLIHALAEFNKEINEAIANDFNNLHKEVSKTFMKANPNLVELLLDLQQKYMLGIVTNGIANWQYDKLEAMGIRSLFPTGSVIISDEVGFEKPNPEIYYKALEYFRSSPDDVVFIGDSWKNDIEGPGNVGISSIWLNKKDEEIQENSKLIGVIKDILEIKEYLV